MKMTAPFMEQAINGACAIKTNLGIILNSSAPQLLVLLVTNHSQDLIDPLSSMDSQDKYKLQETIILIHLRNHPKQEAKPAIAQIGASATPMIIPISTTTTTTTVIIIKDNLWLRVIYKIMTIMSITYLKDPYSSRS